MPRVYNVYSAVYIAALHQLYLAGMAMELNALGYYMTPFDPSLD